VKSTNTTDAKNTSIYYRDTYSFNVIPLKPRSKVAVLSKGHPFLERKATDEEFENFNFKNVGIVTGKTSGILVLDVDDGGPNTLKENEWTIPPTVAVETMNGKHYYFRYPSDAEHVQTKLKFAKGLDFKADGGYVVAPPSIVEKKGTDHKGIDYVDSHQYEWISRPEDLGIAECPDWLLEVTSAPSEGFRAPVEATIEEGSRNSTLFSLARSLFMRGLNEAEVFQTLYTVN
jgi:putative DNA primase/helicase